MSENMQLNVPLLRRRVPNLTSAARAVGLRAATVSNLCTGKTPISKAEVGTLMALARLAGCSLDELIIYRENTRMVETGIKAIDLFAPIVHGGIIGIVACPGSGQMSLAAELCCRMRINKYKTIFWKPKTEDTRLRNIINQADEICCHQDEVYGNIALSHDSRDVFLVADREVVINGQLLGIQKRIEDLASMDITILLVDIAGEAVDDDVSYGPMDTLLKFDINLSKRGIYPSIDPVYSTSTMLEGSMLESVHSSTQQRARKSLRRYRELGMLANLYGMDGFSKADKITYMRGRRLEAYLSQPQYAVEEFTGKPGKWVKLQETIGDVTRLLNGSCDNMDPQELLYLGSMIKNINE